jgi:hypothetical protein
MDRTSAIGAAGSGRAAFPRAAGDLVLNAFGTFDAHCQLGHHFALLFSAVMGDE